MHANGWLELGEKAEVVAVCDVNEVAAKKLAEKTGAKKIFADFRELAALTEIDAVDICTPNKFHTPAAMSALENGKHVLCEKPLAVSTAEVRQLGELADSKGLLLMTAQHMRYLPMSLSMKKFVDGGALGDPYHSRVLAIRRNCLPVSPGFIDSKLSGGGPCMDIGVHCLDACMWLMGFPDPVRATGVSRTNFAKGHDIHGAWGEWDRERFDVEDWACGFIRFKNGATMSLEACWLNHQEERDLMQNRVYGSKGGMEWPTGKYWSSREGVLFDAQLKEQPGQPEAHASEIRDFHRAVTTGDKSPVPWTQTIKVIAILESIYKSQQTGCEVQVEY